MELRSQRPFLFRRDTDAELMYGHRPPLHVLGVSGLKFPEHRHAPIALQYTKVSNDERLEDAVIARDGVKQRLELKQLFKHGNDLFFIGPGRKVVCEIGAMQTRILRVELEPADLDLD